MSLRQTLARDPAAFQLDLQATLEQCERPWNGDYQDAPKHAARAVVDLADVAEHQSVRLAALDEIGRIHAALLTVQATASSNLMEFLQNLPVDEVQSPTSRSMATHCCFVVGTATRALAAACAAAKIETLLDAIPQAIEPCIEVLSGLERVYPGGTHAEEKVALRAASTVIQGTCSMWVTVQRSDIDEEEIETLRSAARRVCGSLLRWFPRAVHCANNVPLDRDDGSSDTRRIMGSLMPVIQAPSILLPLLVGPRPKLELWEPDQLLEPPSDDGTPLLPHNTPLSESELQSRTIPEDVAAVIGDAVSAVPSLLAAVPTSFLAEPACEALPCLIAGCVSVDTTVRARLPLPSWDSWVQCLPQPGPSSARRASEDDGMPQWNAVLQQVRAVGRSFRWIARRPSEEWLSKAVEDEVLTWLNSLRRHLQTWVRSMPRSRRTEASELHADVRKQLAKAGMAFAGARFRHLARVHARRALVASHRKWINSFVKPMRSPLALAWMVCADASFLYETQQQQTADSDSDSDSLVATCRTMLQESVRQACPWFLAALEQWSRFSDDAKEAVCHAISLTALHATLGGREPLAVLETLLVNFVRATRSTKTKSLEWLSVIGSLVLCSGTGSQVGGASWVTALLCESLSFLFPMSFMAIRIAGMRGWQGDFADAPSRHARLAPAADFACHDAADSDDEERAIEEAMELVAQGKAKHVSVEGGAVRVHRNAPDGFVDDHEEYEFDEEDEDYNYFDDEGDEEEEEEGGDEEATKAVAGCHVWMHWMRNGVVDMDKTAWQKQVRSMRQMLSAVLSGESELVFMDDHPIRRVAEEVLAVLPEVEDSS